MDDMKKLISIISFAVIAGIFYWIRAEFDVSLSKYATANAHEDIVFDWGICLLWMVIGGAIGAVPLRRDKRKKLK